MIFCSGYFSFFPTHMICRPPPPITLLYELLISLLVSRSISAFQCTGIAIIWLLPFGILLPRPATLFWLPLSPPCPTISQQSMPIYYFLPTIPYTVYAMLHTFPSAPCTRPHTSSSCSHKFFRISRPHPSPHYSGFPPTWTTANDEFH